MKTWIDISNKTYKVPFVLQPNKEHSISIVAINQDKVRLSLDGASLGFFTTGEIRFISNPSGNVLILSTDTPRIDITTLNIREITPEELAQAEALIVDNKINALPTVAQIVLADKAEIDSVRLEYENLSTLAKSYITRLDELVARENRIAEIEQAIIEKAIADALAIDNRINDLLPILSLKLTDKPTVVQLRADYEALTQLTKSYVTKLDDLVAIEARILLLEQSKAKAVIVDNTIMAIPVNIDIADKQQIVNARADYVALTTLEKSFVTKLSVLEAHEAQLLYLENARDYFDNQVDILPSFENLVLADKPLVVAVRQIYNDLPTGAVNFVTKLPVLVELERKIVAWEDALLVDNEIIALPDVVDLTLADKTRVVSARSNYTALTSLAKTLVTQLERLIVIEQDMLYMEQALEFDNMVDALPLIEDLVDGDRPQVQAVRAFYDNLSITAKSYTTKYPKFQIIERAMNKIPFIGDPADMVGALQERVKLSESQILTVNGNIFEKEIKSSELNLEGRLNASNIRELKLTLHGNHSFKGATVDFKRTFITIGNTIYTIPYGSYKVLECEYNDDTKTTDLVAFDFMIKTHKEYKKEDVNLPLPTTLLTLFRKIAQVVGIETDITSFPNSSETINEDKYADLNYTYRDILDHIAEVAGQTIGIKNNKLSIWDLNETGLVIDYNKSSKLKIGDQVGMFNILNLTREPQHDNYAYPLNWSSIPLNDRVEYVIENNQLIDKERERFAPLIFNQINTLQYTTFTAETFGWGIFNVGDVVTVKDLQGVEYRSVITSELNRSTGMWLTDLKSEPVANARDEYVISTDEVQKGRQAYLLVDKQNGLIEAVVQDLEGNYSNTTQTSTMITSTVSSATSGFQSAINQNAQNISFAFGSIGDLQSGKFSGTNYTFDGSRATFTGGGLRINNNYGQQVFDVDTSGNVSMVGKVTASLGLTAGSGGFSVPSNADGIYNSFGSAARWKLNDGDYIAQTSASVAFYFNGLGSTFVFNRDKTTNFSMKMGTLNNGVTMSVAGGENSQLQIRDGTDTTYMDIASSDFVVSSSQEFKQHIKPTSTKLDMVKDTKVFDFEYKEPELKPEMLTENNMMGRTMSLNMKTPINPTKIGFIAEESPQEMVMPLKEGEIGISVTNTIAILWKAVQELSIEVDKLKEIK